MYLLRRDDSGTFFLEERVIFFFVGDAFFFFPGDFFEAELPACVRLLDEFEEDLRFLFLDP